MFIVKEKKKTISAILILAVVITMVVMPIQSQASDMTKAELKTGTGYRGNIFFYSDDTSTTLGKRQLNTFKYFMIGGKCYPAYCIESEATFTTGPHDFDLDTVRTITSDSTLKKVQAVMDADLTNFTGTDGSNNIIFNDLDIGISGIEQGINMKEYYIKQFAIWHIIDKARSTSGVNNLLTFIDSPELTNNLTKYNDGGTTGDTNLTGILKNNSKKALYYIKSLVNAANNQTIRPDEITFGFTTNSPEGITFSRAADNKNYISNTITTELSGYNIAADNNAETNGVTYSIKCSINGDTYSDYKIIGSYINGFQIEIDKEDLLPGDEVSVTVSGITSMASKTYGYCSSDTKSTAQQLISGVIETVTSDKSANISGSFVRDTVQGEIKINKVDSEDTAVGLDGAEFTLSKTLSSGALEIVATGATISNGFLEFKNLPVGYNGEEIEYTLTEIKAPQGYEDFDLFTTTFALTEDDSTRSFTTDDGNAITNNKMVYGEVEIIKIDSQDNALYLEGAEFTLSKKLSGGALEVVATGTTISDGSLIFRDLDVYGYDNEKCNYILEETKAPAGYEEFDLFTTEFVLTKTDSTKSFSMTETDDNRITNVKKVYGQIDILKIDEDDTTLALEGAEFTLYDATRNVNVTTAATDADGYLAIGDLDVYGLDGTGCDYILKETKAPKGYSSNAENLYSGYFTLTSDENSRSMSFTITNKYFEVAGEKADPQRLGLEDFPDDEGDVLGEEAKTVDSAQTMPYLILMMVAAIAVMIAFLIRVAQKDD